MTTEVEFKGAWTAGLESEEQKVILKAGEQKTFVPNAFLNVELTVYNVVSDKGANVTIRDKSYSFDITNQNPNDIYPVKTITIQDASVSIKNSVGWELATISHTSPKENSEESKWTCESSTT